MTIAGRCPAKIGLAASSGRQRNLSASPVGRWSGKSGRQLRRAGFARFTVGLPLDADAQPGAKGKHRNSQRSFRVRNEETTESTEDFVRETGMVRFRRRFRRSVLDWSVHSTETARDAVVLTACDSVAASPGVGAQAWTLLRLGGAPGESSTRRMLAHRHTVLQVVRLEHFSYCRNLLGGPRGSLRSTLLRLGTVYADLPHDGRNASARITPASQAPPTSRYTITPYCLSPVKNSPYPPGIILALLDARAVIPRYSSIRLVATRARLRFTGARRITCTPKRPAPKRAFLLRQRGDISTLP